MDGGANNLFDSDLKRGYGRHGYDNFWGASNAEAESREREFAEY